MDQPTLQSAADNEKQTGIPEATWRYWRHLGTGPKSVRIGRRVFYRKQDVLDWINKQFEEEDEKRVSA